MPGAPALAALLLQLAARPDALSISQRLGPVLQDLAVDLGLQDDEAPSQDTSGKEAPGGFSVLDLDDEDDADKATSEDSWTLEDAAGPEEEEEHEDSLDKEAITDVDGYVGNQSNVTKNFNDTERMEMHKKEFETEFFASLNLTRARETGELPGVKLCMELDYEPPKICTVKKWGLVNDWNNLLRSQGHPDQQIMVGDEIYKVNRIEWHHNSVKFAQRIADQFHATRKNTSWNSMQLYIRRRHRDKTAEPDKRSSIQRTDRHKFLYVKEWTPTMKTAKVSKGRPLSETMGWSLQYDKDWFPVTIGKIKSEGLIADWNKANPEDRIVEGDELVQVDSSSWELTHNSTLFLKRVHQRIHGLFESGEALMLGLRRPREVAERHGLPVPEESVPFPATEEEKSAAEEHTNAKEAKNIEKPTEVEEVAKAGRKEEEVPCSRRFGVVVKFPKGSTLRIPKGSKETDPYNYFMGWSLKYPAEVPVVIDTISEQGAVPEHNAAHPDQRIEAGDVVIRVANVSWHGDTQAFEGQVHQTIRAKLEAQETEPEPSVFVEVMRHWKGKSNEGCNWRRAAPAAPPAAARAPTGDSDGPSDGDSHGQHQDVAPTESSKREELPYSIKVSLARSTMEKLTSAWSGLRAEDVIAMASELYSNAMGSSVAKIAAMRSALGGH